MFPRLFFSRHEQKSFFYLLIVFCLVYIYELANFNVSIDDEILAQAGICDFAALGRWLHPLVRKVLWPQVVVPAGPLLLFGAAMAISYVYALRMFGVKRPAAAHYAIFAAFVLYPVWPAQLEFSANIIPVAIGLLAAVFAAWLVQCESPSRLHFLTRSITCAFLVSVSVGAYQSLALVFLVFATSGALWALLQNDRKSPPWVSFGLRIGVSVAICVAGMLLSLVFAKITMLACQTGPSAYAESFFHPEAITENPLGLLKLINKEAGRLFWNYWKDFGSASFVFVAAIIGSLAISVTAVRPRLKLAALVVLLGIFYLPTGFIVITGNVLPIRAYLAAAAVMCCFLLLAHSLSRSPATRGVVLALAVLAAIQGLYINSIQQARGWSAQHHDAALASAIYNEVVRRHDPRDGQAIFLEIRGAKRFDSIYPSVVTGTQGGSFFEWDGGNPPRMLAYMRMLGYTNVHALAEETPGAHAAAFQDMPAWPAEGSVRRVGKGFLVKLSAP